MILKIFSEGNFLKDFDLIEGQEYILGRHIDCDIHINVRNGISRKHLKIVLNDSTLNVGLLSELGELTYQGSTHKKIAITTQERFSIGFFDFVFEMNDIQDEIEENLEIIETENFNNENDNDNDNDLFDENNDPSSLITNNASIQNKSLQDENIDLQPNDDYNYDSPALPVIDENNFDSPLDEELVIDEQHQDDEILDDEETKTATKNLNVFLHIISNSKNKIKKSYELTGDNWKIGRDEKADLQLAYPFISRKHFEIIHTNEGLYICDLESGNGTQLNGKSLPPLEHIRIYSDDLIEIKKLKLKVELIDKSYQNILQDIGLDQIEHTNSDFQSDDFVYNDDLDINLNNKPKNQKKLVMRALIVTLLVGVAYMKLSPNQSKNKERKVASVKADDNKNKIEQKINYDQAIVVDIYNLAKSHYKNQEHIECINEIERLHDLTPEYNDSKKLHKLCKNGLEIDEELKIKNERKMEAKNIQEKTNTIAQSCKDKFTQFKSKNELNICLDELLLLNPSHPYILELTTQWDNIEIAKNNKLQKNKNNQLKIKSAVNIYNKAVSLQKQGNYSSAIKQYNRYIASSYGERNKKDISARSIASIRKELSDLQLKTVQTCVQSYQSGNLKTTVTHCTNVLRKYPNNTKAKTYRKEALGKLRKKAKELYTDANLEESLGNISSAKEKWKEITKFHVKTDEYFKKATRKLKKYNDL